MIKTLVLATVVQVQCAQQPLPDGRTILRYAQVAFQTKARSGASIINVAHFKVTEASATTSETPAQHACALLQKSLEQNSQIELSLQQDETGLLRLQLPISKHP